MSAQANQNEVMEPESQTPQSERSGQSSEPHTSEQSGQSSEHHAPEITPPPKLPPASPRLAMVLVGVVVLVLLIAGVVTLLTRAHASRVLAKETEQESIPTVAVTHPTPEAPDESLVLPGSLQAYVESPIYARTNGYLLKWFKDIGSPIKKGELLAEIDTPEVDQELLQARAARQQILAQMDLAKINSDRYLSLRKTDSVSQEEADQQASGYQQAKANLEASDANVRRLQELESFKHVYAPFSGVVTRRNVDPGFLINAGGTGREMFDIARVDPLRVFVSVPQTYAPAIRNGMEAIVTLQEHPGQKYKGTVARTAEAIDPTTRTLLTEVDVRNPDEQLLPGSFGEVHFNVGINAHKVTIPVNAMLFRSAGAQVAVVDNNNKVTLHPIVIGRDFGSTLEIVGGVDEKDRIIVNPSDSLEQGQQVNVAPENQNGQQQNQQKPGGGA